MTEYEVAGRPLAQRNPVAGVKRGKVARYSAQASALTGHEASALLEAVDTSTVAGKRDYALLAFYLATGVRNAEATHIRWGDVTVHSDDQVTVAWAGKGGKTDVLEIPDAVWQAIVAYLTAAGRLANIQDDDFVFAATRCSGDGPLSGSLVNRRLKLWAEVAGLDTGIHVHTLRHTCAVFQYEYVRENDVRAVQMQLHHSSLETTTRYLSHLQGQEHGLRADRGWARLGECLGLARVVTREEAVLQRTLAMQAEIRALLRQIGGRVGVGSDNYDYQNVELGIATSSEVQGVKGGEVPGD